MFRRKWTIGYPILVLALMTLGLIMVYTVSSQYGSSADSKQTALKVHILPVDSVTSIKKTPPAITSKARDLLLFSYMRSGSSLTGELLKNSSDIFFVFEPLIPLAPSKFFSKDSVCSLNDNTCSSLNATQRIRQALDVIVNIFRCNIRALPRPIVDKILYEKKSGIPWIEFAKCLNSSHTTFTVIKTEQCFETIEQKCREASSVVTKVLRLSFFHVDELMQALPNLNVLFLLRDPRAILNSRIQTTWYPISYDEPQRVSDNVQSLCAKMVDDFRFFESTESKYGSNRVTRMKTEDVYSTEANMAKVIHFINKTVSEETNNFIIETIKNKDSLFRKWQNELKPEFRDYIVSNCSTIMKFYEP